MPTRNCKGSVNQRSVVPTTCILIIFVAATGIWIARAFRVAEEGIIFQTSVPVGVEEPVLTSDTLIFLIFEAEASA